MITGFSSVIVWLILCAAECTGDQQCKWPSNGGTFLCVLMNYKVPNTKVFVMFVLEQAKVVKTFNISLKVTNFLALLVASRDDVTIQMY